MSELDNIYWSTGIVLEWNGDGKWWASAKFEKGLSCRDGGMLLKLRTKYAYPIERAIDLLMADVARLRLVFVRHETIKMPCLMLEDENNIQAGPFAPDDWREVFKQQAARLNWYTYREIAWVKEKEHD